MSKTLWLWGEGGYYWLDFGEWGLPSPPSGKRAWEAFIDFAPTEAIQGLYASLRKLCEVPETRVANLSAAQVMSCARVLRFPLVQLTEALAPLVRCDGHECRELRRLAL